MMGRNLPWQVVLSGRSVTSSPAPQLFTNYRLRMYEAALTSDSKRS